MNNNSKNEILWTKEDLIMASKGKDLTSKFLNNKKVTGISIDSRSIKQNDLFSEGLVKQIFLTKDGEINLLTNNTLTKSFLISTKKTEYKKQDITEKKAFLDLISNLEKCSDNMKPEDIQTEIYTVGKNNGYKENLREWFKLIYEVVFGVENGPRLGFFISFFGRKEMISLIKEKIN